MELEKKTTILFPEDMYGYLAEMAKKRHVSVGWLVREACRVTYGFATREEQLNAVMELSRLELPVDEPEKMKLELVSDVKDISA